MKPSIELRIRSMLRAMTEVVIPAIDPDNALAQEQARLVLGHLHALSLQHPHAVRLDLLERRALELLATRLRQIAAGGPVTLAAVQRLARAQAAPAAHGLAAAIEALMVASGVDGGAEFRVAAEPLVLDYAKAAALRGRSWFMTMGFDSDPNAVPAIETMLDQFTRALEGNA